LRKREGNIRITIQKSTYGKMAIVQNPIRVKNILLKELRKPYEFS